jgi:hypothetical protein
MFAGTEKSQLKDVTMRQLGGGSPEQLRGYPSRLPDRLTKRQRLQRLRSPIRKLTNNECSGGSS